MRKEIAETASRQQKLDRRYVTAALMLVMVLASMEQTVTSTAMPTIIGDLHGLEHYSWVASIYLLACTVEHAAVRPAGRCAGAQARDSCGDRAVLRRIGAGGVSAHSMVQLIIFRGLQGWGPAGSCRSC